ncbi:MAG: hypothetical protein E7516_08145 [Ruminococcaceae bacterium]|nr:hypothetical protein [Oscillospiraceae bacterium]
MKKIALLLLSVIFLASCSVQEKVNVNLLTERLCQYDELFVINEFLSFSQENSNTVFFAYGEEKGFVMETRADGQGNTEKINLACTCTDKIDLFTQCVKSVISVYAPDEDGSEIMNELFADKQLNSGMLYYETKWYSYSARLSDDCLYFSVENRKLSPRSEVALSLKQNDIIEY